MNMYIIEEKNVYNEEIFEYNLYLNNFIQLSPIIILVFWLVVYDSGQFLRDRNQK